MKREMIYRTTLTARMSELMQDIITRGGAYYKGCKESDKGSELIWQNEEECQFGIRVTDIQEADYLVTELFQNDTAREELDQLVYGEDSDYIDYWHDTYAGTHGWEIQQ